jgi:hypothetical protein
MARRRRVRPASSTLSARPRILRRCRNVSDAPRVPLTSPAQIFAYLFDIRGPSLGRIRALGKIRGIMMHWIFPEAPIFPDLSVVDRTTARSCTISPMSSPQGEAPEASVRITRAHDYQWAR